jgi:small subunit ribosomal protein S8
MSMQDITSDYIARINNAISSNKEIVVVIKSKLIIELTKKLVTKGFFESFENEGPFHIKITLKQNLPFLPFFKRISTTGKRFYAKKGTFPRLQDGVGFNLVSTSGGIKTHLECLKEGVGGEVILQALKLD